MSGKGKTDQKTDRAPEQKAASLEAKSQAARAARIASHNAWPKVSRTEAEDAFIKLLRGMSDTSLLKPYEFTDVDGADFHRHLGMLIDGLEMLPNRPDHAFDFFFRTVDELSQQLTGKTKITEAMEALGPRVCNNLASQADWKSFVDLFSERLPLKTSKFMAQRLLAAFDGKDDPIKPRAKRLLGEPRYAEFHQKFKGSLTTGQIAGGANDAGIFLQRLISQRAPSAPPKTAAGFPTLNLAMANNLFDESKALWALVSLMAFTSRNERFHGSSLSPFRSSTADERLYASYYFQMLFVYTLAVGLMIELFPGCGDTPTWLTEMNSNMARLDSVFGKWIK